jgi:hypothetical protein
MSSLKGGVIIDEDEKGVTVKLILGDEVYLEMGKKTVNAKDLNLDTCDECGAKLRHGICKECLELRDRNENE